MKQLLVGLVLFMVSNLSIAQRIEWSGKANFITIADKVSLLEDPAGSLSFEQVSSPTFRDRFVPSEKVILNFGFTESVYWIKFSFNNPTSDNLTLEVAHAFLPVTDLYYRDATGEIVKIEAGYSVPLTKKMVKHHHQIFPLPPGARDYYIRLISNSHPISLSIHTKASFEIKANHELLMYGFYLGFMVFVILSNLFFFFSLKNKMYLFYAGVVLLYISYATAVMDGFILYFIPNLDLMFWYVNIPTLGVPVQLIYALLFLEARKYTPTLNKYSWWLVGYFTAYIFLKFLLPPPMVYAINTVHALISFSMMCFVGYKTGQNGNRLGYYFGIAYFIYFLLVLTEATYIQIGRPGYLAGLSHVALATLIEAFILSFLLSKRFEWEKEETEHARNEAQKQVLEKTRENEHIVKEQNVLLEKRVTERTAELNNSLAALRNTQAQLVQSEKMASLGQLTAGIAHEIQNPLNFVNNYAEVNIELIEEIREEFEKGSLEEATTILNDLEDNQRRIVEHGKRADGIVKGMLEHTRHGVGKKALTNINALADEYVRLAYHGFQAKEKSFDAVLETNLDESLPHLNVVPQDIGRVLFNILNNAMYAINERCKNEASFTPKVIVTTKLLDTRALISIRDNGPGIPKKILDKVLEPFFTTKPTGQGTGLGLSLTYDIVKAHGGDLRIESVEGEGTVFMVELPVE